MDAYVYRHVGYVHRHARAEKATLVCSQTRQRKPAPKASRVAFPERSGETGICTGGSESGAERGAVGSPFRVEGTERFRGARSAAALPQSFVFFQSHFWHLSI